MGWMTGIQFLTGAMMGYFFLFTIAARPALGPTQPPVQWVKWAEHEADHSSPSSAEVNAWKYTSTPPVCLHGMVLN
jgi:hypothetical protein